MATTKIRKSIFETIDDLISPVVEPTSSKEEVEEETEKLTVEMFKNECKIEFTDEFEKMELRSRTLLKIREKTSFFLTTHEITQEQHKVLLELCRHATDFLVHHGSTDWNTRLGRLTKAVYEVQRLCEHYSQGKELPCSFCQKSYLTFFGLRRHLQFHREGKLQQTCPHCDKTYRSPGALKMHLKTHSLPCVCQDCGKSFSRPWLLKGHLRTHTGEKPFSCENCGRSFADRSNLRAHLQTHSGEKKHRCRHCGQSFARVQVRIRHEATCSKL